MWAAVLMLVASTFARHAGAQGSVPPPSAAGIDAILVADTREGPEGTEANLFLLNRLFEETRKLGYDATVTVLEDDRVTPGAIVNAIRRLDPARMSDRTLFVYYAGHGGTDPRTGHFLRTPWGDLSRSTLLAEVRARSPRLSLLITDCCSTRAKFKLPLPQLPPPPERRAVENLLLQHVGCVDMNGSSYLPEEGIHQAAFYQPTGGIFTSAFLSMFRPAPRPAPEAAPVAAGQPDEGGYWRRFHADHPVRHDRNEDGFIDWAEAREYLDATVAASYLGFRAGVRSGEMLEMANPADRRLLESQASQDPQVFGPLAVRSDRPAAQVPPASAARAPVRPRFGATFAERYERGGAYLEITGVEPRSPATRVSVWNGARRSKTPLKMAVGDTIHWANGARVRNYDDLLRVLDAVPEGGELNIAGQDASTGRHTKYEATAVLDRYAE